MTRTLLTALIFLLAVPAAAQTVVIPGTPRSGDSFGRSLAYGDFDNDGDDDLAIGAPYADGTGGDDGPGAVTIVLLSPDGTVPTGALRIRPGQDGFPGDAAANSAFGLSLAAADFDGDGDDDLAIGAPDERVDGAFAAGAAYVIYNDGDALSGVGASRLTPLAGAQAIEQFGWALAAGDLDGDGTDDLAVGAIGTDGPDVTRAGSVTVFRGAPGGVEVLVGLRKGDTGRAVLALDRWGWSLAIADFDGDGDSDLAVGSLSINDAAVSVFPDLSPAGSGSFDYDDTGLPTQLDPGFGEALAAADFDGDGFADLAIGAPSVRDADGDITGAVVVVRGSASGVDLGSAVQLAQGLGGVPGPADADTRFGRALAAGDLDGSLPADLAIGAPLENVDGAMEVGTVTVVFGGAGGLSAAGARRYAQGDAAGTPGGSENADEFGAGLAIRDAATGRASLAVGAPSESIGAADQTGAVTVLPVTGDGPAPPDGYVLFPGATFGATDAEVVADGALALRVAPNPAAGAVRLSVTLAEAARVRLVVTDMLGREVAVVLDGTAGAGPLDAAPLAGLAPGTYLARLSLDGRPARSHVFTVVR